MCLRLEAGIHQDARVTRLDEQRAAADMVRAAHRGDGQAAGAHLRGDGALRLPVISVHAGLRARLSGRIEAVQFAQRCHELIQALGSPQLAGLIATIGHALCTLAQLRRFADGQRHEPASAAASVVPQVGFKPVPAACFGVQLVLRAPERGLGFRQELAKLTRIRAPRGALAIQGALQLRGLVVLRRGRSQCLALAGGGDLEPQAGGSCLRALGPLA